MSEIVLEFQKVLLAGLNERKEGMSRRKITLHTLRRFTKTVISNQAGQDFSEMILGHKKSVYYTLREPDRRKIYGSKCMSYLTFLDYTTLEATGKSTTKIIISHNLTISAAELKSNVLCGDFLRILLVWLSSFFYTFLFFSSWSAIFFVVHWHNFGIISASFSAPNISISVQPITRPKSRLMLFCVYSDSKTLNIY